MSELLLTSRWRLVTSADDERAAEAAAASLLAGLLIGEPVDLCVAPYFRGGFQVKFALSHAGSWEVAQAWLRSSVERTCIDWTQVDGLEQEVSFWSHALNIPRAEALEVVMTSERN